jgi:NAD(P)-dependent dehydrogenase (short-subunit alcohol dehydrogenase family)
MNVKNKGKEIMKLKNRTALITGGASGIGKATAELFASEGARIAIADIDNESGQKVVKDLNNISESLFIHVDVRESKEVEAMVKKVMDTFGSLDILITSAGIGELGTVIGASEDHWDRTINTNLKGTWLCSKYSIQAMSECGGGSIVTISSVAGLHPFRRNVAYGPSKAGVIYLTQLIALEHGPEIRANSVCPGCTDTPMIQRDISATEDPEKELEIILDSTVIGRMASPMEIARSVLFLASDDASYITGVALPVDGGRLLKVNPIGALK